MVPLPPNDEIKRANSGKIKMMKWTPDWVTSYFMRKSNLDLTIPASQNDALTKAMALEGTYGRTSKAQYLARSYCVIDSFVSKPIDTTRHKMLIIESDNDPLIYLGLRSKLKMFYPFARVFTFHDRGHFPYLNTPVVYADEVRFFFEGGGM